MAWVQFLVRELRSHKLHGVAKKKKKESRESRWEEGAEVAGFDKVVQEGPKG